MVEEDDMVDGEYETTEEEDQPHQTNIKIFVLSGVPWFHTLRLKGVLQGHKITILVGGGGEHIILLIHPWWRGEKYLLIPFKYSLWSFLVTIPWSATDGSQICK